VHFTRMSARTCVVLCIALLTLQGLALVVLGRPFICECGYVSVWYGNPSGPETSQQLTDWYTFTHLLHGFLFYLLLWLVAPKAPLGLKLVAVFGIEAMWEIAENSPLIVERYRQSALALGYTGDSIVNSMTDSLATALGFGLAHVLPVRVSIAAVIGVELFLDYTIHDNLTLNIIHLIRPDGTSLPSNPPGHG
jgi:Protein of unknown function (DUF2585)